MVTDSKCAGCDEPFARFFVQLDQILNHRHFCADRFLRLSKGGLEQVVIDQRVDVGTVLQGTQPRCSVDTLHRCATSVGWHAVCQSSAH